MDIMYALLGGYSGRGSGLEVQKGGGEAFRVFGLLVTCLAWIDSLQNSEMHIKALELA